ncbi:MAG: hypothetical protein RL588_335 [Pseudomonadota bacterium]|jgi:hypothetical protein
MGLRATPGAVLQASSGTASENRLRTGGAPNMEI